VLHPFDLHWRSPFEIAETICDRAAAGHIGVCYWNGSLAQATSAWPQLSVVLSRQRELAPFSPVLGV
jgi:hypothetical protein